MKKDFPNIVRLSWNPELYHEFSDVPPVTLVSSLYSSSLYKHFITRDYSSKRYSTLATMSAKYTQGLTDKEIWRFYAHTCTVFVLGGARGYKSEDKVFARVFNMFRDSGYPIYVGTDSNQMASIISNTHKFPKLSTLPFDIYEAFSKGREKAVSDMIKKCHYVNAVYHEGKKQTKRSPQAKYYTELFHNFSELAGDRIMSSKIGESSLYISMREYDDKRLSRPYAFGFMNKKDQRKYMRIDGEEVVEVDTCSSWLSITCIKNNIPFIDDQYYMFKGVEGIERDKIKCYVNRSFTTKNKVQSYLSEYKDDIETKDKLKECIDPVLEKIVTPSYYKDLLDVEAKVMLRLMEMTLEYNKANNTSIFFIPNCDGIICKKSDAELLTLLYQKAFTQIIGNTPRFKIKTFDNKESGENKVVEETIPVAEPVVVKEEPKEIKTVKEVEPVIDYDLNEILYTDKTGTNWTRQDILDLPTVRGDKELAEQTLQQWRANNEEYGE